VNKVEPKIELREITMSNFRECIDLTVRDDQRHLVATNLYSLAEAKADGVSSPFAIYCGEVMVGFTMYWFDALTGTGHIDRLMIDRQHQGYGYGKAAMLEVINRLRNTTGCYKLRISFEPSNTVAESLYSSLGFCRTGEIDDGEVVAILEFPPNE
jgi:diamine N-acetyltransferase